ncbi:hypothetical protein ACS0TY_021956 [Phlomoides rotata]
MSLTVVCRAMDNDVDIHAKEPVQSEHISQLASIRLAGGDSESGLITDLQLHHLLDDEAADTTVFINLCIQKINTTFNVWILQSTRTTKDSSYQLPDIGGFCTNGIEMKFFVLKYRLMGEIYTYKELKEKLKSHKFRT